MYSCSIYNIALLKKNTWLILLLRIYSMSKKNLCIKIMGMKSSHTIEHNIFYAEFLFSKHMALSQMSPWGHFWWIKFHFFSLILNLYIKYPREAHEIFLIPSEFCNLIYYVSEFDIDWISISVADTRNEIKSKGFI